MVGFLGNPKNVFWEALLLTAIVFIFGIYLGYALENSRLNNINEYYANSEIFLMDALALNEIVTSENLSCSELKYLNVQFADRIYQESKILERYDQANKLSEDVKLMHKRYDLMRTLLWISADKTQKRCGEEFSIVVYLYEREAKDLTQKAVQNVWSKILTDLKEKEGSKIVLIPIAVDNDITSLDSWVNRYDIKDFPVVIVNGNVVDELSSVKQLEEYLK